MNAPRHVLPLAALFAAAALRAAAAAPKTVPSTVLEVSASLPQLEYLRGEAVKIELTVRNKGREVFIVDDYGEYLKNRVRVVLHDPGTGGLLDPWPGAPSSVFPQLTLRAGESKTETVDLRRFYDLSRQGRYRATALVERGDEAAATRPVSFSVVEGIEIGAALRPLKADERRLLRFALLYWDRNQRQDLFLRITDPERGGSVVGFVSLGPVVRVAEPTLSFGDDDTVTVVQQIARDRFARTKLDVSTPRIRVLERNENLLSADAVQNALDTRLLAERLDAREKADGGKKDEGGLFGPRRTRTPVPSAATETAPIETVRDPAP